MPTWKEFLERIVEVKRLLDLAGLLGSIESYHGMLVSDVGWISWRKILGLALLLPDV